jgi:hypothetical protein
MMASEKFVNEFPHFSLDPALMSQVTFGKSFFLINNLSHEFFFFFS